MMGPMMGPMRMPIDQTFQQFDQFIGAPPPEQNQFQGYYLTGAEEQNLGAPPPHMGIQNEQNYQQIDQQMVGGPLDVFLNVNYDFFREMGVFEIIFTFHLANPRYYRKGWC